MPYEMQERVRYSETAADGEISLCALMNYLQDCSTFHSRECEAAQEDETAWMILYWQVEFENRPQLGDSIVISTWPYEWKGLFGKRNYTIKDAGGYCFVKASSIWALIDRKDGKPVRISEKQKQAYPLEESLDMEYLPRKIKIPAEPAAQEQEKIKVYRHHLDVNQHVNNVQYIQMAQESLPENFKIRRLRVEYRSQARLADTIFPKVIRTQDAVLVVLCGSDQTIYAIIEFTGE